MHDLWSAFSIKSLVEVTPRKIRAISSEVLSRRRALRKLMPPDLL
jgi:hypothetical protein